MQKIKLIAPLLGVMLLTTLNAKIIEVNQLFNKTIVKVKQENVGAIKSFYGKTQLDETQTIDIVTRYDGFITKLNANKTYMNVKKGEALFSIYSDKVLSIQKELQVSKNINKKLYKSAVDKLVALDITGTELERIKKAKKTVKDITVRAPMNAIVMKKNINDGSAVKKGKLILQLANLEKLWVLADVYQKDLSFVKLGMPAKIYLDGFSSPIQSKVDYIYPVVEAKTKTVKVRFILDNSKLNYFPNMFANVKLQNSKRTMLTLPKTAVLNKGSKYYVFKPVSDSEFEPIEVEVNRISSSKYEIIEGLQANEEVINNALFLLDSDAVTNALYEEEDEDW